MSLHASSIKGMIEQSHGWAKRLINDVFTILLLKYNYSIVCLTVTHTDKEGHRCTKFALSMMKRLSVTD